MQVELKQNFVFLAFLQKLIFSFAHGETCWKSFCENQNAKQTSCNEDFLRPFDAGLLLGSRPYVIIQPDDNSK